MTRLDLNFVRSQFPAFQSPVLSGHAFFENAGGSYPCAAVVGRLHRFYTDRKVQPYGPYPGAEAGGAEMDEARHRLAALMGCAVEELSFGPSTSANTFVLANAVRLWLRGQKAAIVVTNQDHEANSGVWRRLADEGIEVREWQIDPATGTLDVARLEPLLADGKVRLLAFPHCSNVVAEINPVAEICALARARGVRTVVDGVSYAPHGLPDFPDLGADVYLFSAYKTYGPHQGIMLIRKEFGAELPAQGHWFNAGTLYKRFTPAGPDHAQVAACAGMADYIDALYAHHVGGEATPRARNAAVHDLMRAQEVAVIQPLLDYLAARNDLRLIGPRAAAARAPTVAVALDRAAEPVSEALGREGIACWAGDFYAVRPIEAMGIDREKGVLRMSAVHYTSADDVARLIAALEQVLNTPGGGFGGGCPQTPRPKGPAAPPDLPTDLARRRELCRAADPAPGRRRKGTMTDAPLILWFRRDLRFSDQRMLSAAVASGRPLIPLAILDPETLAMGAAARWRWGLAVEAFAQALERLGSRLILRRGPAGEVLDALLSETGAAGVWWSRSYDPATRARDEAVKAALKAAGREARSFPGVLLQEPWEVQTGAGEAFKVFTPFWNALRQRDIPAPLPAPLRLAAPEVWPLSDRIADWRLAAGMDRGAAVVLPHQRVGEAAARARLEAFSRGAIAGYGLQRDRLDVEGTSGLSENLTWGEIGPREIWQAGLRARDEGAAGAEAFLRQLGWRDFAWHLLHHSPQMAHANWRAGWDDFPWRGDNAEAEAWRRGMTGEPLVDAAMREMYVTGRMHNRARMVAASYLTKHLLTHWKVGLDWFAECLTDWDPASNALGWQWVAGSGPDAAPFFRIFNPATQAATHDPDSRYLRRFVAELSRDPGGPALDFFRAAPRSWALDPERPYPRPLVALAEGRARALSAFHVRNA